MVRGCCTISVYLHYLCRTSPMIHSFTHSSNPYFRTCSILYSLVITSQSLPFRLFARAPFSLKYPLNRTLLIIQALQPLVRKQLFLNFPNKATVFHNVLVLLMYHNATWYQHILLTMNFKSFLKLHYVNWKRCCVALVKRDLDHLKS